MHRGVANIDHKLSDLGQNLTDVDKDFPPIWEILSKNQFDVGVFGSLHSYSTTRDYNNYSFYVPDTFSNGPECYPDTLSVF
jgi:hypothetical protein